MRFVFAAFLVEAAAAGGGLPSRGQKTPWSAWLRLDCRAWNQVGWREERANTGYFHLPDTVRPCLVHGIGKRRL
jgi:hypothetical protein